MKKPDIRGAIESSRPFIVVKEWIQAHSLPGLGGIPIYDVLIFIRKELKKEKLGIRANAMAFSFFLAIFPSIIFLFTLLPYLPVQGFTEEVRQSVAQVLPAQGAEYVNNIINELTSKPQGGLLSIGLLLTLYFASNGMLSMLRGFEKSYDISYRRRSWIRRRMVALSLTLLLGLLFIISMSMIVFGQQLLEAMATWTEIDLENLNVLLPLRWIVIIALFYSVISVLYKFGPALKRRIRFFSPGATLATVLSVLSSLAFAYYVNRFDTYNQIYGSIGALIVLMLWLQINSFILLIGYELNASIKVNKALFHQSKQEELFT